MRPSFLITIGAGVVLANKTPTGPQNPLARKRPIVTVRPAFDFTPDLSGLILSGEDYNL
jgi:hypothetical protein